MKVRSGFVTNSSSTSFIIISKGELTQEVIRELLRIPEGSPLQPLADELWNNLRQSTIGNAEQSAEVESVLEHEATWFGPEMTKRLDEARTKGATITVGSLGSDGSEFERFLCMTGFSCDDGENYIWAEPTGW